MDYPRDKLARDFFRDTRFKHSLRKRETGSSVMKSMQAYFSRLSL